MFILKLVIFGPFKRLGALIGDGKIVDLNLAYNEYLKSAEQFKSEAHANVELPVKLQAFIEEGDSALQAAKKAIEYAKKRESDLIIDPEGIKIWAPLPSLASRICCAGANFVDHAAGTEIAAREGRKQYTAEDVERVYQELKEGKRPIWGFWKMARCVIGPDEDMIYPSRTTHLDYEVELAAIIGKKGKDISDDETAMEYVWGYTGLCDWSIRDDVQPPYRGRPNMSRWQLAKNFDTSCSLGPCIVTKDEISDPYNVQTELRLNGETRQNASTSLCIRKFPEWLSHISRNFTIYPGDIFALGTCAGTAMDTTPRDEEGKQSTELFVKIGDVVEIKVSGIGAMKNKVVAEK